MTGARVRRTPIAARLTGSATLFAAVGLLAACSGGGNSSTPARAAPMQGVVVLRPAEIIIGAGGLYEVGASCDGASTLTGQDRQTRSYFGPPASEITEGTSVIVADDKGQTIGVGQLGEGKWIARPTETNLSDHICEMPFSVELSRSSPFYAVQVGTQQAQSFAGDSAVTLTFRDS